MWWEVNSIEGREIAGGAVFIVHVECSVIVVVS